MERSPAKLDKPWPQDRYLNRLSERIEHAFLLALQDRKKLGQDSPKFVQINSVWDKFADTRFSWTTEDGINRLIRTTLDGSIPPDFELTIEGHAFKYADTPQESQPTRYSKNILNVGAKLKLPFRTRRLQRVFDKALDEVSSWEEEDLMTADQFFRKPPSEYLRKVDSYRDEAKSILQGQTPDLKDIPQERLDWQGPGALLEFFHSTAGKDREAIIKAMGQIIETASSHPIVAAQVLQLASALDLSQLQPIIERLSKRDLDKTLQEAVDFYFGHRSVFERDT